MGIGKNIALYRKLKGITQEELGSILGVTNQAVSKWESEVSMPDILLLPDLINALDISFEILYGIETKEKNDSKNPDMMPDIAYNALHYATDRLWTKGHYQGCDITNRDERITYRKNLMKNDEKKIVCVSNDKGAVILTDSFSFIDRTYKTLNSENIFLSKRLSKILTLISDEKIRKVYAYMYKQTFEIKKLKLSFYEILESCKLSKEDTENILDELCKINLIDIIENENSSEVKYSFVIKNGIYIHAIYSLTNMFIKDAAYLLVRDTSMISDGSFFDK